MQQAARQLFSFVKNEEKREIASTNYITKTRNLKYIHHLNVIDDVKTLLISTTIDDEDQELIQSFEKIVVLKNRKLDVTFLTSFTKQIETDGYVVYTK